MPNDKNRYDMLDDSARQEELRLKKVRQGIISDTSNEEYLKAKKEKEEKPLSLSEKVSNFWYHYKWTTLVVGVIIVAVVAFTVQALSATKYDTTIIMCTYSYYSEDTIESVSDDFLKYIPDINGNGKKDIGVFQANYAPSGADDQFTGYQTSLQSRIMAELAAGENCIYVIDEQLLNSLSDKGAFADLNELLSLGADSAVYGVEITNADILNASAFQERYYCKKCDKYLEIENVFDGKCQTCNQEVVKNEGVKNSCRLALRVYKEGTDRAAYDAQLNAVKEIYKNSVSK